MKESVFTCRFCGKKISVITYGLCRKSVVDAEAVMVVPDAMGDDYIRIDGTKIRGREAAYESDETGEAAYRIHRRTCGVVK